MSLYSKKKKVSYVRQQGDKWRPDEDAILLKLIQNNLTWREIADQLPGRSEQGCMGRYSKRLRKKQVCDSNTAEIVGLYAKYNPTYA